MTSGFMLDHRFCSLGVSWLSETPLRIWRAISFRSLRLCHSNFFLTCSLVSCLVFTTQTHAIGDFLGSLTICSIWIWTGLVISCAFKLCLKRRPISFRSSTLSCQRHFQTCSLVIGLIDPTWHAQILAGIVDSSSKSTAIIPSRSSAGIALMLHKMLAKFALALSSSFWGVVEVVRLLIGQFWISHWVSWQLEHCCFSWATLGRAQPWAWLLSGAQEGEFHACILCLSWSIGSAPKSGRLLPRVCCCVHGSCIVDFFVPLNHWFDIWLFSNRHSCVQCPICWQLVHRHSLSIGQSVDL